MGKKIEWLSVLQGWSMLLVVIGHVTLTGEFIDKTTPIASTIERAIYSFHMPLFMFISGWLFYFTAISRNKTYKDVLTSKLRRLGIPFLAFTLATTLLKLALAPLMKRAVDLDELINTFIFFKSNPLGEMWFIITLFILMALYPLYKQLLKNKASQCIGLIIALALYFLFPRSITYYQLDKVAGMMIFFYSGILACKYNIHRILDSKLICCISFPLFIILSIGEITPDILNILTKFVGIIFSISLCIIISKNKPNLFISFRDYTFQIFLMGIFFQMAIRYIYNYLNIDSLYIPLYLLSILIGIYIPVYIAKTIKQINSPLISKCVGL